MGGETRWVVISCLVPVLLASGCLMSKKGTGELDTSTDVDGEEAVAEVVDPDMVIPDALDPAVEEPGEDVVVDATEVEDPGIEDPVVEDAAPEAECTTDRDCDDGDACTTDTCVSGSCVHGTVDADGDGYVTDACGGTDCDDGRRDTHPGATEVCLDGVDQDCDTIVDGPMLMGTDLRVSDTSSGLFSMTPTLAWSGSEFGVGWHDNRAGSFELFVARVSATGTKMGMEQLVGPSSGDPFLAWGGSEYGASWVAYSGSSMEIAFARIAPAGTVVGTPLQVTAADGGSYGPAHVWNGSEYGVSWYDDRDGNREIYFTRVSGAGSKIGPDVRVTNDPGSSDNVGTRSIAWTGSQYGVCWIDDRHGTREVFFARVAPDGAMVGSDVRVTSDAAMAASAALVWTGSQFGLVWTSDRDGNREVYFARLAPGGALAGSHVRVTTAVNDSDFPDIAWTGSEFGVAWNDERMAVDSGSPYFVRISVAGVIVGPELQVATHRSIMPSLQWTGSEYGVTWEDDRFGSFEIFFNRIGFCE
jgi:hypothetical protein